MGADTDSRDDAEHDVEQPDTEEEKVEMEWHFWLFAILILAGVALILFPPTFWPNLGFALLAVAVIGWILKEAIEKTM